MVKKCVKKHVNVFEYETFTCMLLNSRLSAEDKPSEQIRDSDLKADASDTF